MRADACAVRLEQELPLAKLSHIEERACGKEEEERKSHVRAQTDRMKCHTHMMCTPHKRSSGYRMLAARPRTHTQTQPLQQKLCSLKVLVNFEAGSCRTGRRHVPCLSPSLLFDSHPGQHRVWRWLFCRRRVRRCFGSAPRCRSGRGNLLLSLLLRRELREHRVCAGPAHMPRLAPGLSFATLSSCAGG